MADVAWLMLFTGMLSVGQLLFKRVGLLLQGRPLSEGVWAALASPTLYLSLLLYAAATALWIWILSRVPLSQAYPWVGVGVVLVPLLAQFVHGEKVNLTFWIGALLVAVGIVVTQYGVRSA